jgi:hypothetical protein
MGTGVAATVVAVGVAVAAIVPVGMMVSVEAGVTPVVNVVVGVACAAMAKAKNALVPPIVLPGEGR